MDHLPAHAFGNEGTAVPPPSSHDFLEQQRRVIQATYEQQAAHSSMRDAPPQSLQGPDAQQQLNMWMFQAQQPPNALPILQQHEPMHQSPLLQQTHAYPQLSTFQQAPQLQAYENLLARYQHQHNPQFLEAAAANSSLFAAAMGQPTLQDMMFLQGRATEAAAFDMTNLGTGGVYGTTHMGGRSYFPPAPAPPTAMWMNDLPTSLQQQSFQDQLQLQQQQLLNQLSPQSQLQLEQQLRRRSSMSSSRSLSPIGPVGRLLTGGPNNLLLGNTDYTRLMMSNAAPLPQLNLAHVTHRPAYPEEEESLLENAAGVATIRPEEPLRKDKKKRTKSFPEKLMEAMMEHENERAVAWLPDGKSFVIVSPDLFVNEVISSSFKEAKYASFVRKLHRWGFIRLTSGTGTDCFHHPSFNRNYPEYAARITCAPLNKDKTPETTKKGLSAHPRGEKPPSLAGVEKFIRAKAAAGARPGGGGSSALSSARTVDPFHPMKSTGTLGRTVELGHQPTGNPSAGVTVENAPIESIGGDMVESTGTISV